MPSVTLSDPGDQTNLGGDMAYISLFASSSNSDPITFAATGLPGGLSLDSDTGEIFGTINNHAYSGTPYAVTITATDTTTAFATQSFGWTVNPPDISLSNPGSQTLRAGDVAYFDISGSSSDSYPLAFTATGLPSGLSMDSSTGEIVGTIANHAYSGTPYSVTITATDTSADVNASQSFNLTVTPPDVSLTNPGNQTTVVGDTAYVDTSGSSSDAYPLAFTATGLPSGLSIDSSTGEISGTIDTGADTGSPYSVTITATDSSSDISASQSFSWTVNPIVAASDDTETINQFASLTITASTLFSDADDNPITMTIATDPAHGTATINDDGDVSYVPSVGFIGTDSFTVGADDGYGGTAFATVTVTVQPILSLDSSEFFQNAGGTTVTITVSLSAASTQDITFHYATSDDTATEGTDYDESDDTLTISAGQTTKSFTISLLTNEDATDGEDFLVTLSAPTNAALDPAWTQTKVDIFTGLGAEEEAVTPLNTLSDRINSVLSDIDTLIGGGGTGITGTTTTMTGYLDSLWSTWSNPTWSSYNALRTGTLQTQVNNVLTKAYALTAEALDAGEDTEGEEFRIEGIYADIAKLNAKLAAVSALLEGQATYLDEFDDEVTDETAASFRSQETRLGSAITGANVVAILNYYVPVPGDPPESIGVLNGYYDALMVIGSDAQSQYSQALAAQTAMNHALNTGDWDCYYNGVLNLANSIADTAALVSFRKDPDDPDAADTTAYDFLTATQSYDGVSGDKFAMKGVNYLVGWLGGYLRDEMNIVNAQISYLESIPDTDPYNDGARDGAIYNLNLVGDFVGDQWTNFLFV